MTAITFDTLKLAQKLRDRAKYTPEQAENTASVLSETFSEWGELQNLATKEDINALKTELKADIREIELKIAQNTITITKWITGVIILQVLSPLIQNILPLFRLH